MTILNSLLDHNVWQDFLQTKKDGGHLSKIDEKQLGDFILQKIINSDEIIKCYV